MHISLKTDQRSAITSLTAERFSLLRKIEEQAARIVALELELKAVRDACLTR